MTAMDEAVARAQALLEHSRAHQDEMVDYLVALARIESPTDVPGSQAPVQALLSESLRALGFNVRYVGAQGCDDHLWAVPADRVHGAPSQQRVVHRLCIQGLRSVAAQSS